MNDACAAQAEPRCSPDDAIRDRRPAPARLRVLAEGFQVEIPSAVVSLLVCSGHAICLCASAVVAEHFGKISINAVKFFASLLWLS